MCLVNLVSRLVLAGLGHDAIHGTLMPQVPMLQNAFSSFALGGLVHFDHEKWHKEHVLFHHPHTKMEDDPDENREQNIPFWRLTNETTWTSTHEYVLGSHILVPLLIPLGTIHTDLPKLFSKFAALRKEAVISFSSVLLFHALPFLLQPLRRTSFAAWFLTSALSSLFITVSFHCSHLAEHLEVPFHPGVDWGERQMRTTTNFGCDWGLCGTLDLQLEHHLFPMLSYENQKAIQPIVKETAMQFGIPYNSNDDGILAAIQVHLAYMLALGRGGGNSH